MNLANTILLAERLVKDVRTVAGFKVAIEFNVGDVRKGKDKYGRPWEVRLPFAYGRLEGTKGLDGEAVDCFIGPLKNPKRVWVVGMPKANGNEDKVMLGFASKDAAIKAFLRCYNFKRKFLGHVSALSTDKLRKRLITRRGKRISASGWETNPWSNYAYQGFDPVPPKNTVPVENEGYDEDDDPWEVLMRKDPDNVKFYTELTRRLGAKTVSESAVIENWPYGGITDGRP